MVNPRKIYAIDTGLVAACSRSIRSDWGHLLENFVFLELRRSMDMIEYYRTEKGREVDFIVTDFTGRKSLIQVCAEMTETETRQRELRALSEAMRECDLDQATIVTLNQEETLEMEDGQIRIIPASLWALGHGRTRTP